MTYFASFESVPALVFMVNRRYLVKQLVYCHVNRDLIQSLRWAKTSLLNGAEKTNCPCVSDSGKQI